MRTGAALARALLVRGMLTGLLAGLLMFAFARLFGEPLVQHAIDFETAMDLAAGHQPDPDIVSRGLQRGLGLLTACTVGAVGYGGIFALVFTFAYGRIAPLGARTLSLLLALAGFLAVFAIPDLKYPANPPSVGHPDTIGLRTALYFEMILVSIASMTLGVLAARALVARLGLWNACLAGAALFVVLAASIACVLQPIDEVPARFDAVLLWRFRVVAWGLQLVLYATLGLVFGPLAERLVEPEARRRPG